MKSIKNSNLTAEQLVLALRDASTHPDVRLFFQSAGLIDCDEVTTLRHVVGQSRKLLKVLLATDSKKGHVSDERMGMANSILMGFANSPTTGAASDTTAAPSRGRILQLLYLPRATGFRKLKEMEDKRAFIRHGHPAKA